MVNEVWLSMTSCLRFVSWRRQRKAHNHGKHFPERA